MMIMKNMMKKTMEVMSRTERVRNFICSNCTGYGVISITPDEAKDILNILEEANEEIFLVPEEQISRRYNTVTRKYIDTMKDYFVEIKEKTIPSDKVDDKICKLSKAYIHKVSKVVNMDSEGYVLCMLREKMYTQTSNNIYPISKVV